MAAPDLKTTLVSPSGFTSGGVVATPEEPKPGIPVMSEQQWDRIYRKVRRIKQPTHRWENLAWASVGLLVTTGFGLAAWWFGNDEAGRAAVAWQGWIYGAGVAMSVVVLGLSLAAQQGRVDQLARDKDDALEEMRDFHTPLCVKDDA